MVAPMARGTAPIGVVTMRAMAVRQPILEQVGKLLMRIASAKEQQAVRMRLRQQHRASSSARRAAHASADGARRSKS